MSSKEGKDEPLAVSEDGDKETMVLQASILSQQSVESNLKIVSKSTLDGSGDHLPSYTTDIPSTSNLEETVEEIPRDKTDLEVKDDDLDKIADSSQVTLAKAGSHEKNDEDVLSVNVIEGSEDEDLVLKWDDSDEPDIEGTGTENEPDSQENNEKQFLEPIEDQKVLLEANQDKVVLAETIVDKQVLPETIVDKEVLPEIIVDNEILPETIIDKEILQETIVDKEILLETIADKEILTETIKDKEILPETIVDKEILTETIVDKEIHTETIEDKKILPETIVDKETLTETIEDKEILMETIEDKKILPETIVDKETLTETIEDKEILMETIEDKEILTETIEDKEILTETIVDKEILMETIEDNEILTETIVDKEILPETIVHKNILAETIVDIIDLPATTKDKNLDEDEISEKSDVTTAEVDASSSNKDNQEQTYERVTTNEEKTDDTVLIHDTITEGQTIDHKTENSKVCSEESNRNNDANIPECDKQDVDQNIQSMDVSEVNRVISVYNNDGKGDGKQEMGIISEDNLLGVDKIYEVSKSTQEETQSKSMTIDEEHNKMEVGEEVITTTDKEVIDDVMMKSIEVDELSKEKELLEHNIESKQEEMQLAANSTKIDDDIANLTKDSISEAELSVIEPKQHGIVEPNAMTEIPTQELINVLDNSMDLTSEIIEKEDSLAQNMSVAVIESLETDNKDQESLKIDSDDNEKAMGEFDIHLVDNPEKLALEDQENDIEMECLPPSSKADNLTEISTNNEDKLLDTEKVIDDIVIDANKPENDTSVPKLKLIPISQLMKASLKEDIFSIATKQTSDNTQKMKPEEFLEENLTEMTLTSFIVEEAEKVDKPVFLTTKTIQTEENSGLTEDIKEKPINTDDITKKTVLTEEIKETGTIIEEKIEEELKLEAQVEEPTKSANIPDLDKPSSSQMVTDDQDDGVDVADNLGLLAESSRVRHDDDEQETSDNDDDDDDFDQDDESSNQMIDQSEDSAQLSESDAVRATPAITDINALDEDDAQDSPDEQFGFQISNVISEDKECLGDVEVSPEDISDVQIEESALKVEEMLEESVEISTESQTKPLEGETDLASSKLKELLLKQKTVGEEKPREESKESKQSPLKAKKLEVVDVESSSEDDIQEVKKPGPEADKPDVASANIVAEVEVTTSESTKESEISPLNKSESTIKKSPSELPPTKAEEKDDQVFNLDSDEDEVMEKPPVTPKKAEKVKKSKKRCLNHACTVSGPVRYYRADLSTLLHYDSAKKRAVVCEHCAYQAALSSQRVIEGVRNMQPLLSLMKGRDRQQLVEILDSESDEETEDDKDCDVIKDEGKAAELESKLTSMFNETWVKFMMDDRLKETENQLNEDIDKLEEESAAVLAMLDSCQAATDALRTALYATFEAERVEMTPLVIVDTPGNMFSFLEPGGEKPEKRRYQSLDFEPVAKKQNRQADTENITEQLPQDTLPVDNLKLDDDKDISVVHLSAEAAPPELPPPGELVREPLKIGMMVYAMRNAYGSWLKARVIEITPKNSAQNPFTMCRVRFEIRTGRTLTKVLPARCLAYILPATARMTIGTRVVALFKDTSEKAVKRESYYSGVVAEIPNPVNKYRYLVFFDDGYAQYVQHSDTRLVCEFSNLVWEEVHPFSRDFVKEYLLAYPERPMVRLHKGQSLKTEWNGKWWVSRVVQVDASLVRVYFEQDKRYEWIYRGSTRLAPLYLEKQAAGKARARPMPRNTASNLPYVEYTRQDEPEARDSRSDAEAQIKAQQEEIRRQRAVAKKSTSALATPPPPSLDTVTSRVVYYTPKNAIRPHKMVAHSCGPHCKRTDVLALKDLRTYNPLAKPLLSGWERQIARYKGHKEVMYRAPCGRRVRNMAELHRYLSSVNSDMGVELFDFTPTTHCLAEFVLNKCRVGKKDLSHGKENVPVPCVNYYDDSLPEFCSYNTERTPTAGVPLNLDPDFLCGCDCTDDCQDKSKCACWRMTLEGARTIGLSGHNVGYVYKRLPEPLPSGIYECNVRCKCKSTCLNRVAQHPLQLKLQVFKTLNRGWGIRALNDVPKGSFLCIYAGNLLTDATANLDGLNEGDEYLAELDYIEVVEAMKEGYEDDIPERDKKLDKKEGQDSAETSETETEEEVDQKNESDDGDFEPGYIPNSYTTFSKRLRKRIKEKKDNQRSEPTKEVKEGERDDDCITISDDEELREPARFAAQAGMGGDNIASKYRSVRAHFGADEACYIMDAKVQGNIGRYLNHSCSPNVFVQNVFVDSHDPRFPWVAFFALSHIKAGTELTWNYNYDVGSVPGKALYCYCGAANCRGRLL